MSEVYTNPNEKNDTNEANLLRVYHDKILVENIIDHLNMIIQKNTQCSIQVIQMDMDKSIEIRKLGISYKLSVLEEINNSLIRKIDNQAMIFPHGTRDDITIIRVTDNYDRSDLEEFVVDILDFISKTEYGKNVRVGPFKVTYSAGIAVYPFDANDSQQLFWLADGAVREAKNNGRNIFAYAQSGFFNKYSAEIDPIRMEKLENLSLRLGKDIDTLVKEGLEELFEKHAAFYRFCCQEEEINSRDAVQQKDFEANLDSSYHYNRGSGHTQIISDLCFVSGSGDYLVDKYGGKYIDFNGTLNLPLGHTYDHIIKAQERGLPLNSVSYSSSARDELCSLLKKIFPQYTAFQFYSAGTEANEGAIRYATAITGKDGFASFRDSYHGRTRATVSLCNMDNYNGERLPGYFRVPYPTVDNPDMADVSLEILNETVLKDQGSKCAGVFIEPIQGKTVRILPDGFLKKLYKGICKPNNLLLIADEYLTSMRTGTFSECINQGVEPDIMTIGKCLGNGIPFAVLMCHERHAHKVWEVKGSTTFGGNPLACASVLNNMETIRSQQLMNNTNKIEKIFMETMQSLKLLKTVKRVSAKGALAAIEFSQRDLCLKIGENALAEGILVSCIGYCIRITPSFTIDEKIYTNALLKLYEIILLLSNQEGRL